MLLAVLLAFGCSKTESEPTVGADTVTSTVTLPAAIPEGTQCAECGMYVEADGRFSGEAFTADGKTKFFCDIGDLLIHLGKAGESEIASAIVRDYYTNSWINAHDAFYLADAPVRTPMRFGIAAFERRPDAEAFRAENGGGTIYTYAGIQADKPYE